MSKEYKLNTKEYPFLDAITLTAVDNVVLEKINTVNVNPLVPQLIATPLMQRAKIACNHENDLEYMDRADYYNNTDSLLFLSSVLNNLDCEVCEAAGFGEAYIEQRAAAFYSSLYTEIANTLSDLFSNFIIDTKRICLAKEKKYDISFNDIPDVISRALLDYYNYIQLQKNVSRDKLNINVGAESILIRLTKSIIRSLASSSNLDEERLFFFNTELNRYMNEINIIINSGVKQRTISSYIIDTYYFDDKSYNYSDSEKINIIDELFDEITTISLAHLHNSIIILYHNYYAMFKNSEYYNTVIPAEYTNELDLHVNDNRYSLLNTELLIRDIRSK